MSKSLYVRIPLAILVGAVVFGVLSVVQGLLGA